MRLVMHSNFIPSSTPHIEKFWDRDRACLGLDELSVEVIARKDTDGVHSSLRCANESVQVGISPTTNTTHVEWFQQTGSRCFGSHSAHNGRTSQ